MYKINWTSCGSIAILHNKERTDHGLSVFQKTMILSLYSHYEKPSITYLAKLPEDSFLIGKHELLPIKKHRLWLHICVAATLELTWVYIHSLHTSTIQPRQQRRQLQLVPWQSWTQQHLPPTQSHWTIQGYLYNVLCRQNAASVITAWS